MIIVKTIGADEVAKAFQHYSIKFPQAVRKANEGVAKSLQFKARAIIDAETTAHTGTLRTDVRRVPVGEFNYQVIAGEYTQQAVIIEEGRKAIMGYRFIPTQQYPLEGYAVPSPGGVIAAAKGIHFMRRGTAHAEGKAVEIFHREITKAMKESGLK